MAPGRIVRRRKAGQAQLCRAKYGFGAKYSAAERRGKCSCAGRKMATGQIVLPAQCLQFNHILSSKEKMMGGETLKGVDPGFCQEL
jgi:hypothetical protein